jgi:WD40 repeat protein/serine/threonine protein kinase
MLKLKLNLLGSPQLEIDSTPIELERRKAMALLAYLALTEKSHSRDSLAALLWPEADQSRARTSLRHNLWTLNKALGNGWLDISRETVGLKANPDLWVDVNQFRLALAACQIHNHIEAAVCPDCLPHLREAVSLYRDDFLTGFTLRDSPEFDEWQRFQTEELRRELTGALERLIRGQSAQEDFKGAIPDARRWLALDPLHEPAHRQLMELYARTGQRAAALYQYNECERILQEELGVPPSMETTTLAERIRLETAGQQGQLIKSYELQELIGAGGFGEVYRAYQPQVRREVAIKVILPQFANQLEFIRRFEAEAHMVAQLEHPHIVPLYDYWREPDGAYLVMRWLRGGSLEDALKGGPWSPEATVQLLDQIAAALMLAHQRGIIHRDLKPANILLDEGGNVYLTDFGIAKVMTTPRSASQTQPGVVPGSPAYMAPEAVNNEPLTPQTDIYSLGVMLFEILTGQHPFPDTTAPMMLVKHLSEPLPPLQLPNPDLATALNEIIQHATAKNPADRYADAISLATDFRQVLAPNQVAITGQPDESTPLLVPNPYKGLRSFQEGDAVDFFGRDTLVDQLLIRLMLNKPTTRRSLIAQSPIANPSTSLRTSLHNFLAIVGPSGSGKSSLVKAGLIPALRQNAIPGSKDWFIVEMTPGPHPLEELETALLQIAINPPPTLLDQLQTDERGLLRAVERILPDDETELLLVIDQFEELFTLVEDEAVRSHFLDSLHVAVTVPESRLRVVITLRADFYDRPLLYPGFGDLLRQRMETVLPLSSDELAQAIAGPAERVGAILEVGLIPLIIADVQEQPGTLPLMQYALTELFEQRQGRLLTIEAYQTSGGVMGALARRADELYTELDNTGRATVRRLFLRLVTLGEGVEDARRRVLRSELSSLVTHQPQASNNEPMTNDQGQMTIDAIIDTFGRHRLLTFDRDPVTRGPTVEVAHEALIREWGRLRAWLDQDREFLMWQQRLRAGLHQWQTSDQDEGALLRGAPLAEAENWLNQRQRDLNEAEREFIQASLALRERQAAEREAQLRRELDVAQKLAKEAEARRQAEEQHAQEAQARAQEQIRAGHRLRWLALGLALFLVAAMGAAWFAFNQREIAQSNFETAERIRLAAQAQIALDRGEDVIIPALLALRSLQYGYSPEADAALLSAMSRGFARQQFVGHTDALASAVFSPDGQYVLTAANDATARLWDAQTGQEIHQFNGHTDLVSNAIFIPNGKRILTGSADQTVRLWDAETGQEVGRLPDHNSPVWALALSPDGQTILTSDESGSAWLWDLQTTQVVHELSGHGDIVLWGDFSPDGRMVFTGGLDKTARLWDVEAGQEIGRFEEHAAAVSGGQFSPDGRFLVTASYDNTARLWDVKTGQEVRRFIGHTNLLQSAVFSADGRQLLTASLDNTVRLWDIKTGQELRQFIGHTAPVDTAAFSPDGQNVLTGSVDRTARLWNISLESEPRIFSRPFRTIHSTDVVWTGFSSDGEQVLTGNGDGTVQVWDIQTGQINSERSFETGGLITDLTFSSDNILALTASGDGVVQVWDIQNGQALSQLTGHTGAVWAADFSPDRRAIVTGSEDGSARVWEVQSGRELHRLAGHGGPVRAVAFSPDGRSMLTGGDDGLARLWNAQTGQEIHQFSGHAGPVLGVAFSPDGQSILTGSSDQTVRLWEVETRQAVRQFVGHTDQVWAVAFSPDGRYVLTGSDDRTARLWDAATGRNVRQFVGHISSLRSLAFSSDSRYVLTGDLEQAYLWHTDLADLIATTCAQLPRDFTAEERALYNITDDAPTCAEQASRRVTPMQPPLSAAEGG